MEGILTTILIVALVVLSVIDVKTRRLPDCIVLPLGGLGLLVSAISQFTTVESFPLSPGASGASPLIASITGMALGSGIPLLIEMSMSASGRPGSIGGGDVKLFGVLGVFLGPAVLWVMLLANLMAAVSISSATIVAKRGASTFAFGPYIAVAAAIVVFTA